MVNRITATAAIVVTAGALALAARQAGTTAAQSDAARIAIDADDIGGVVTGPSGPEAGVWVIAETKDLPTTFRRIVVTDDRGRFVVPDLPKANYRVWVRGYGLVDSAAVMSAPGKTLALTAVPAPNPRAAAQYYPANYWYSLIQVPPPSAFPIMVNVPKVEGAGDAQSRGGLGIGLNAQPPGLRNQAEWIAQLKVSCELCHQMGTKATREIPSVYDKLGTSQAKWEQRVQAGQQGQGTVNALNGTIGHERSMAMFADWTDRIAAGELPQAPPRPAGVERNIVVTLWDVSDEIAFIHDSLSTDKRNPTVNGGGPVYAGDFNHDSLDVIDPKTNSKSMIELETLVDKSKLRTYSPQSMAVPSPYFGDELIWHEHVQPNHIAMDKGGRLWVVAKFREDANIPAYCKEGSSNMFAKNWPMAGTRGLTVYDPKTKKFSHVDTCFYTHHLAFGEDKDDTLYASGNGTTIGWLNTRMFLETGDAEKAQGWCPAYYDINGDGRIDPKVDKQVPAGGSSFGSYGIAVNPLDNSVWYASPGTPGRIMRLDRGAHPPETCVTEAYEPPFNNPNAPGKMGFYPRGVDLDRNGIVWTALGGSGHLASFDRRKCKVTKGEAITDGQHCVEGWTLYTGPGPKMKGVTADVNSDFYYFNFVDQHDTFGLGKDTPMVTGTGSDALMALDPRTGKWTIMRVPYPIEFFTRSLEGRIDDPNTGWKGRGLWAPNASRPTYHTETGKGTPSVIAHFQLRPDPLAK